MGVFLGCIADDFTGATDLAGLLARSGVKVSLRMGIPKENPENSRTSAIEVIALKCRTSPVGEAVDETLGALAWLRQAGAQRFFWKYCSTFDSTAKGNIGPVAEALMAALETDQTIYCPAFPENGRSIYMGNLFVGELPLAESPMKDHPLTPMRDSNLMRLLAPQVAKPVGLVNHLTVAKGADAIREKISDMQTSGISHLVVDAVANVDLYSIAEACMDMKLLTGGSAIAMPLPALFQKQGLLAVAGENEPWPELADTSIVLSGSCSAMTREQVHRYLKQAAGYKLDPLHLAKHGMDAAREWLLLQPAESKKMIYATAEPAEVGKAQEALGIERAGKLVEDALADLAVLARNMGVRRFVIAGGETSGAVTKALGIDSLRVGPEIAPGVPWNLSQSAGETIAITLKSGNFGTGDFFETALRKLKPDA